MDTKYPIMGFRGIQVDKKYPESIAREGLEKKERILNLYLGVPQRGVSLIEKGSMTGPFRL